MKYPQQISMPSGIQLWLEEQLEARGVDASVYSKYILKALCNDSEQPVKTKDSRVRVLIEELREKLKGLLEDHLSRKEPGPPSLQDKAARFTVFSQSPSKSKADHYSPYPGVWSGKRAFGSSVGKNRTISEGNNRDNKFTNNLNWLEENKENNLHNKDVPVKMRSRSTVKQHTTEKLSRIMAKSLDRKDCPSEKSDTSKSRRLYQLSKNVSNEKIRALWATDKSFDDLSGCDRDLAMDFQQLLESPESTNMFPDLSRSNTKHLNTSFIQCGTNITSSIWSEKAEDTMDCSTLGDESNVSSSMSKSVWNSTTPQNSIGAKQDEFRMSNLWGDYDSNIWGDSNIFSRSLWKAIGKNDKKERLDFKKWWDVESTKLVFNGNETFFSSIGSTMYNSLSTLNHNKEDSSFTEVIPKGNIGLIADSIKELLNAGSVSGEENASSKKDDEDLLTSMKTHFRPIKIESVEVVPSSESSTYPDGTTFSISRSLDKINFNRSPGGGLYVGSDKTNKYLEYNEPDGGGKSGTFVPKYRVRQTEKCCQTEESSSSTNSIAEPDCNEMFFPEDDKQLRIMIGKNDKVEAEDTLWSDESCIKLNGWITTWPASGNSIWSNEPNIQQIWCGKGMWNSTSEDKGQRHEIGERNTQLQNELTLEGEELLSKISQHVCPTNFSDTPPKATLVDSSGGPNNTKRALPSPPPHTMMQF